MAVRLLPDNPSFVEDERGLIIPARISSPVSLNSDILLVDNGSASVTSAVSSRNRPTVTINGTVMAKDKDTGIIFWPSYGSWWADYLMGALVIGDVANLGPTPVVDAMLSTIVTKRQAMAGTWDVMLTGRESPVNRANGILSAANDGEGAANFVRDFIGALDIYNRGSFVSRVPIGSIPIEKWSDYGMQLVRVRGSDASENLYYLDMTTESFRENGGLWALDSLDCIPTGIPQWPFWLRKRDTDGELHYVLINREFAFQRIQQVSGRRTRNTTPHPGYGQSGVWRYSPFIVKGVAVELMDWEALVAQPPRGIALATGLDQPTQFKDQLFAFNSEREEQGIKLYPGVFFMGTISDSAKIQLVRWTEPPSGYTPESWDNARIDNLAAAFHMNSTHLRVRLGEGALTQSGVAEALEAETVMAWMRREIEHVFELVVPKRVIVHVNWKSDRQKKAQAETGVLLGRMLKQLNDSLPKGENLMTRQEMRQFLQGEIGFEIPKVTEDDDTEMYRESE